MTENKIIETAKHVIETEIKAVKNLINNINKDFVATVEAIYNSTGRVVFTGMGKSGLIARKIVATLNSTGTPSIFLHPTDALHGDLGMVRKEDIVILVSKSGNTEELADLVSMLKRMNVIIIGMVGNPDSKIGKASSFILKVNVEEEACPFDLAPTASTTAALVMGDALAVALLEKRGFTEKDFAMLHPAGSLGKRLSLRIEETMKRGDEIPKVSPGTSIKDTIFEITSKRLGMTCVVDENGTLKGIITDGDLRRLLEKTLDIKNLTAKDLMTPNPKTTKKEYLASFALQQMENFKITSIIVTDNKNIPVGIVHLHDLVNIGLQAR